MTENIEFENSDGVELRGSFRSADSKKGIVMAHGFSAERTQFGKLSEIAMALNSEGFNVLNFDFSGHGESGDAVVSVANQVDDLISAVDFMLEKGLDKIGLMGVSMGGLTALETSRDREEVKALFLVAPLTDALPDYRRHYDQENLDDLDESGIMVIEKNDQRLVIPEDTVELKENLDQDAVLSGIDIPVKIIHGTQDSTVPVNQSRRATMKLDAELLEIEDDHYWEDSVKKVKEEACEFFLSNLSC